MNSLEDVVMITRDRPLTSIILPAYNPTFVEIDRAIHSCINQNYDNIEIIVVDDGSTIESSHDIDKAAKLDNRVRIIKTANCGVSNARNIGLDAANGEYIAFLDSDDELAESFVYDAIGVAQQYGFSIVIGGVTERFRDFDCPASLRLERGVKVLNGLQVDSLRDHILSNLNPSDGLIPPHVRRGPVAKLFSRECIADTRFDTSLSYGEDAVFVTDCLNNARSVGLVDKQWYIYYQYEGSAVHTLDLGDSLKHHINAISEHYSDCSNGLRNALYANVTRYFFRSANSLFARESGLHLFEVRRALYNESLHEAFCKINLDRYKVPSPTRFRYWLCKHRMALPIAIDNRFIAIRERKYATLSR